MNPKVMAISLWQPWASLWASGRKSIETRSWPLRLPLPCVLAVHAAKKWNAALHRLCLREPFATALRELGIDLHAGPWRKAGHGNLPLGEVVGAVRVWHCVRTEQARRECDPADSGKLYIAQGGGESLLLGDDERAFGDYSPGRHAWLTDARVRFAEPLPLCGRQGLFAWEPPPEALEQMRALLSPSNQPPGDPP